jgi:hypothetical protein
MSSEPTHTSDRVWYITGVSTRPTGRDPMPERTTVARAERDKPARVPPRARGPVDRKDSD